MKKKVKKFKVYKVFMRLSWSDSASLVRMLHLVALGLYHDYFLTVSSVPWENRVFLCSTVLGLWVKIIISLHFLLQPTHTISKCIQWRAWKKVFSSQTDTCEGVTINCYNQLLSNYQSLLTRSHPFTKRTTESRINPYCKWKKTKGFVWKLLLFTTWILQSCLPF